MNRSFWVRFGIEPKKFGTKIELQLLESSVQFVIYTDSSVQVWFILFSEYKVQLGSYFLGYYGR